MLSTASRNGSQVQNLAKQIHFFTFQNSYKSYDRSTCRYIWSIEILRFFLSVIVDDSLDENLEWLACKLFVVMGMGYLWWRVSRPRSFEFKVLSKTVNRRRLPILTLTFSSPCLTSKCIFTFTWLTQLIEKSGQIRTLDGQSSLLSYVVNYSYTTIARRNDAALT